MTVGISASNLASAWLNTMRGGGNGTTFTAPAALYVQLHTGDPGASGTANVSAGSTTRVAATLAASSAGSALAMTGTSPAWTNGGTSETLTHISVWGSSSAGTFYYSAALSTSQAWASGNTFTLTALGMSLSPQAA